ncbi:MAG: hypothetical protein OES78_13585 [Chromatiales bacterium]|jgi:hypothetical protein|nr:hypothetical protein [Chromatiales bacterium]
MSTDPEKPYSIEVANGRVEVRTASGRVIMACADQASAAHYATLLNEAFRAGYKSGFRDALAS